MARGDRLLSAFGIRPCATADIPVVLSWFNDDRVCSAIEDEVGDPASRTRFLTKLVRLSPQRHGQGGFIVTCRNRPVGFIHLMWINWISRTTEIDLLIDPHAQSRIAGFMTIQKAGEIAFDQLNLHKIYGFVYDNNERSLSPLRRMLTVEATMTGAAIRNGTPTDVHIASITAEGYHRRMAAFGNRRHAG